MGDLKAVHPRQHDIQQDEVERGLRKGVFAVVHGLHFIAFGFQVEAQAIGKMLFVFDNQDARLFHGLNAILRRQRQFQGQRASLP